MPVYLLHGFRWPRAGSSGIRVHIIMHNLEDCSPEYIQNAHSQAGLLESFRQLFPNIMKELEGPAKGLTFLEQYDPDDVTSDAAVSQPFAFVGDKVVTIAGGPKAMAAAGLQRPASATSRGPGQREGTGAGKALSAVTAANGSALSVNVEEVVAEGPGFTSQAWEALAELRDKLAAKEKIGWWVVYNGDPERHYDGEDDEDDDEDDGDDGEEEMEEAGEMPASLPARTRPVAPTAPLDEKEVSSPALGRSNFTPNYNKEMPPPPKISIKDTRKADVRQPVPADMPAGAQNLTAQEPPKQKALSKTEGFRKFFGKKG